MAHRSATGSEGPPGRRAAPVGGRGAVCLVGADPPGEPWAAVARAAPPPPAGEPLGRHLCRHQHLAPLEAVVTRWRVAAPAAVARQWAQHGAGAEGAGEYEPFEWVVSLRGLVGFLRLRLDPRARDDIRPYALAVRQALGEFCPQMAAFLDDN